MTWTHHIYTPLGFVKENILGNSRALDIGCGQRKLPGAFGIDIIENSQADLVHDLKNTPWPIESNSFDIVLINHVLEHVDDVVGFLSEVWRVTKTDGHIVIQVPYFRSTDAYADPTHRRFFTSRSLDYFLEGTGLSEYNYVPFRFRKVGFWYGWPQKSRNPIKRLFKLFIHRYPNLYDQYLSLLFPIQCVTWELEVRK
tara:strand:- start:21112 stop:21705 length:594 start_codon:yes stop_codon:yes gene_type:complete